MIRPRKPLFFAFLPLVLLSGYLALVYELSLIYLAFSALGTLLVVGTLLALLTMRGLAAKRRHPHEVMAGRAFDVELTIENRTPALSSMFFTVEDCVQRDHEASPKAVAILSLLPAQQTTYSYRARIDRRGPVALLDVKLSSRFPFGLFEKRATVPCASSVLVLPRPGRLRRDIVREESAPLAEHPLPARGGLGEFHGVRQFQWGDSPRQIHWATSARKASLCVREYEREIDRRLLIVLDAAPHEKFERAITMCATIASHYLARSYRVALATVHTEPTWVPFGSDLTPILRALAVVVEPVANGRTSKWDERDIRGAQVAVVGVSVPAGLGAATLVDPSDPALIEDTTRETL